MKHVTIRELRNEGRAVVDRVLAGESLLVTRSGEPVAELRPVRRRSLSAEELLAFVWSGRPEFLQERSYSISSEGFPLQHTTC